MMQQSLIKEKGVFRLDGITSDQIKGLLEKKHWKDVFIDECKNGETWGARDLLKLDAWVLQRSYSPLRTIGYEIKVTRADFEQDQKWVKYLDLCHSFFFVCPAGLIRSTDLPSGVGLIWVSSTGKLHTKNKAEVKQPDIAKLNGLLIYALMSRSQIVANMNEVNPREPQDPLNRLDFLKESVERAQERKELAYFISGHVRDIYEQARKINTEMASRESDVNSFEEKLKQLGIEWDSKSKDWIERSKVRNEIELLGKQINPITLGNMENAGKLLTNLVETIRKLRAEEFKEAKESSESD